MTNFIVELGERRDVEGALRHLKKTLENTGFFSELRRRTYYMKPSDRRRSKQNKARRKALKFAKAREEMDLRRDTKEFDYITNSRRRLRWQQPPQK